MPTRDRQLARLQASYLNTLVLTTLLGASALGGGGPAGPQESTEVVRAQLELSVCDLRGAGTDDAVSATLGQNAVTWLDRPGSDFERAKRYTYDLLLDDVHTLSDIRGLEISKPGNDALCLREIRLIVNGKAIFVRTYPSGVWLDSTPRLEIGAAELRANASWQSYSWSMPEWIAATGATISRQELTERLMSCVASAIHDAGLSWSSDAERPIELRRKNDSTISVDVALEGRVRYWVDRRLTLGFDVSLCNTEQPEPTISNVELREVQHWYTRASGDGQRILVTLRRRLTRARPLVVVGGICPHFDRNMSVSY